MPRRLDAVERTALLTAALRAAETKRPDRLYEDPYAAMLAGDIGPQLLAEVLDVTYPADGERVVPSTPDYNAIRTRFFDGFLQHAARRPGMRQIVLAPSGMDSRAYRLEWPDGIRYFEVDRPAVLDYKKSRLGDVRPRVDHRTVAVDLVSDTWEADLEAAGYDPALPSTWLLEGLLYYIPEAETHRVLDRIAAMMTPGSLIAADICGAAALRVPDMQPLLNIFAGWGCPVVFGDDDPEGLFAKHGFTAEAVQPGTAETAEYGRWTDDVPPRTEKDVRRFFYVHGKRR
ncbi:class I SAM-dependent methyltransferase [Streptomyces fuscichromogenes]|uniref:class I SAM-dependent methyltransferase n=1 Tax=Streptomyces fuscichromogenes TaxID=1324013 RepID=UPI00381926B5